FLSDAREIATAMGARRIVLDSLSSASLGVASDRRFRELVFAMAKHFSALGATTLMTLETTELMGAISIGVGGVSAAADNLVLQRYVEVAGRLERAISVLKARGVRHSTQLRRFEITSEGARVSTSFEDMRGVLTGVPQPI